MRHSIGRRPQNDNSHLQYREILLMFDVPVHREEGLVLLVCQLKQLPILNA